MHLLRELQLATAFDPNTKNTEKQTCQNESEKNSKLQ